MKNPKKNTPWKGQLSDEAYHVLREKGTEPAFSSPLNDNDEDGSYRCHGCGSLLFGSESKFDSGCGWPSFDAAQQGAINEKEDLSHGRKRTEILCSKCDGHLGHVFSDGITETGLRYCVNGLSIDFNAKDQGEEKA
jgi:peptide-methionine (R)-S-oxide reductase